MSKPVDRFIRLALFGLLVPVLAGCRSLGPRTVPRDRFDYSAALGDSWKSMMLLNIVKTRYLDLPVFLDVGQVVSAYTLEASASLGGNVNSGGAPASSGNTLALGGAARYSQQPTITYTPLTGDKFLDGFLNPVDPARVFALIKSGYAADFVLQLGVESLNGLRNQPVSLASKYQADPEFFRVLKLLREIQDARAFGLRVERPTNGTPTMVIFFRGDNVAPEIAAQAAELRQLIGLSPTQSVFRLVSSPLRGSSDELSVDTRSLWQMMASMAMGVEVPLKHRERKLAPPVAESLGSESLLLNVHSGSEKPKDAYAVVPYEGQWFWIANDDWKSKRTFTSILFLFTLADAGPAQNAPTLTIPAR